MDIKISTAQQEDVRGIQEVFYLAWLDTYPNKELGITIDDIQDRFKDRLSAEKINKRIEQVNNISTDKKFLVAKDGNKVVGVCNLVKHEDKNQLQAIYVLPEYQRNGIGILLWKAARDFFDMNKDTIVWVANYNSKAISFYKRLGFVETGDTIEEEKFRLKSGAIIPEIEMILRSK